jgi:hypothetical protein
MSKLLTVMMVSLLVAIAGCDPFEKGRKEQAEKTRIECLDKVCEGDSPPWQGLAKR